MIYLYTDGSSTGGVGPGGYGWIVTNNGEVLMAGYGSAPMTTNNLMELQGAISGLEYLAEFNITDNEGITLISDSQYTLGIADGRYNPRKNIEESQKLRLLAQLLQIKTLWVRGHNGNQMNELADSLAKMGKRGYNKGAKSKNKEKQKRKMKWKE